MLHTQFQPWLGRRESEVVDVTSMLLLLHVAAAGHIGGKKPTTRDPCHRS